MNNNHESKWEERLTVDPAPRELSSVADRVRRGMDAAGKAPRLRRVKAMRRLMLATAAFLVLAVLIIAPQQREGRLPPGFGQQPDGTAATDSPRGGDAAPSAQPAAVADDSEEDRSVRAVAEDPAGRLLVKPVDEARAAKLGAPSCYGLEDDWSWRGTYEAVWEPAGGGQPSVVLTFPADFEIVQPQRDPVAMKRLALGGSVVYVYVPRYTDCHGLETYLFGVSAEDGRAFPIPFEMEPGRVLTAIGQLPRDHVRVVGEELVVTGGYGAGQDFIDVYHFRYDAGRRMMALQRTEKVKPNDLEAFQ
ncbi:MAG: hypothetical protein J7639_20460 [Paenibacillaceae bacterium]|nr:hypothetical protein [Paenibacillaceae bacterium]